MSRSFTYTALTLRVKASGESNREAWFLTAEEGVIRATVFGGPKSRLRARVAPFHEGTLWIYHDPVRDTRKVSDFDVSSYRPGIRELYERSMAAGAVAETILATHGGGGSWPLAARLAGSVLDALDGADAAACSRMGIYFLWYWAQFIGVRPDLSASGGEVQGCPSCEFRRDCETLRDCEIPRDAVLWYSAGKETLLCEKYMERADSDSLIRVGPGARHWLKGIESIPPEALTRVSLDAQSLEQARAFSKAVLAGALGKKLPTWDGI